MVVIIVSTGHDQHMRLSKIVAATRVVVTRMEEVRQLLRYCLLLIEIQYLDIFASFLYHINEQGDWKIGSRLVANNNGEFSDKTWCRPTSSQDER